MARSAAHAARLPRRRTGTRPWRRARPAGRRAVGGRIWFRRLVAIGVLAGLLAAGYLLWMRDLGVFAVRDVTVTGLSSVDQKELRSALTRSAREMTTLHVREDALRAVARRYPSVESLSVQPRLPSGLQIEVTEREPVAVVDAEGRDLAVADDGTVLPGLSTAGLELPALQATAETSSERLREGALEQARVLGAVPKPLRGLIEQSTEGSEGVDVLLAGGVSVRFGDASRVEAKWDAAARILADSRLGGLSYLDVRAPERPAVGGAATAPGAA